MLVWMWPFVRRDSLARLDGPTPIDVVTRIVSPNDVPSPTSGLKAAFVHIEVVERVPEVVEGVLPWLRDARDDFVSLGGVIFGDLLTLEISSEESVFAVEVVARRAQFSVAAIRFGATPMQHTVPELVPIVSRASRGGVICYREHLGLHGERLRLRATVEPVKSVVGSCYRSAAIERLVVRDDLGPVLLDEMLESSVI